MEKNRNKLSQDDLNKIRNMKCLKQLDSITQEIILKEVAEKVNANNKSWKFGMGFLTDEIAKAFKSHQLNKMDLESYIHNLGVDNKNEVIEFFQAIEIRFNELEKKVVTPALVTPVPEKPIALQSKSESPKQAPPPVTVPPTSKSEPLPDSSSPKNLNEAYYKVLAPAISNIIRQAQPKFPVNADTIIKQINQLIPPKSIAERSQLRKNLISLGIDDYKILTILSWIQEIKNYQTQNYTKENLEKSLQQWHKHINELYAAINTDIRDLIINAMPDIIGTYHYLSQLKIPNVNNVIQSAIKTLNDMYASDEPLKFELLQPILKNLGIDNSQLDEIATKIEQKKGIKIGRFQISGDDLDDIIKPAL